MLRLARAGDADRLLEWRNDPASLAMYGDTAPVERAGHVAWLRGKLADPDSRLFIAEVEGEAAGYVRFDSRDGGALEVSIATAPAFRGRGLAGPMLRAGCAHIRGEQADRVILARVRPTNAASNRLFIACGFVETARDEEMIHYSLPAA